MIIRTTKELGEFWYSHEPRFTKNYEWVLLSDLKKQIERLEYKYCEKFDDATDWHQIMHEYSDELLDLCNSSEQNEQTAPLKKERAAKTVFGEHNTGEGVSQGIFQPLSSSSPVQNPKKLYCECHRMLIGKKHHDVLSNKPLCPVSFQVCRILKPRNYIKKEKGGCCGGAL